MDDLELCSHCVGCSQYIHWLEGWMDGPLPKWKSHRSAHITQDNMNENTGDLPPQPCPCLSIAPSPLDCRVTSAKGHIVEWGYLGHCGNSTYMTICLSLHRASGPPRTHNFKRKSTRYSILSLQVVSLSSVISCRLSSEHCVKSNTFPFPTVLVWGWKWMNIAIGNPWKTIWLVDESDVRGLILSPRGRCSGVRGRSDDAFSLHFWGGWMSVLRVWSRARSSEKAPEVGISWADNYRFEFSKTMTEQNPYAGNPGVTFF